MCPATSLSLTLRPPTARANLLLCAPGDPLLSAFLCSLGPRLEGGTSPGHLSIYVLVKPSFKRVAHRLVILAFVCSLCPRLKGDTSHVDLSLYAR